MRSRYNYRVLIEYSTGTMREVEYSLQKDANDYYDNVSKPAYVRTQNMTGIVLQKRASWDQEEWVNLRVVVAVGGRITSDKN